MVMRLDEQHSLTTIATSIRQNNKNVGNASLDAGHPMFIQHQTEPQWIFPWQAEQIKSCL